MSLPCLLLLTGILAGVSFDPLAEHNLYTVGALAEALNVLTLLFMFWVVQCAQITLRTYLSLTGGLTLWLVSGVIDLMDEVYFQPLVALHGGRQPAQRSACWPRPGVCC